jgi:hypothetical protein
MRIPDVPYWLTALAVGSMTGIGIACAALILVVPDIKAERRTPERIAACHDRGGTAQLDGRGTFTGCLLPPPAWR